MPKVWRAVGGEGAMLVFTAACNAGDKAWAELNRRPSDEESEGLQRVVDALNRAKEAVEQSPLPRRSAVLMQVTGAKEPVPVWLGWRDEPTGMGPSMTLTGFLDTVADLVRQYEAKLPIRSVRRVRADPEASAFVRWLNWFLAERSIPVTPTKLAIITNAALGRHDEGALTESGIRAILRDMPEQFRT